MLYAKAKSGAITQYPYGLSDLRSDNYSTSFPNDSLTRADTRAAYDIVEVNEAAAAVKLGWNPVEATPTWDGSQWNQAWTHVAKEATDLSDSEITAVAQPVKEGFSYEQGAPELKADDKWYQTWVESENDWQMNRRQAYGEAGTQIEYITENGLAAWQTKVDEIKTKYPKA